MTLRQVSQGVAYLTCASRYSGNFCDLTVTRNLSLGYVANRLTNTMHTCLRVHSVRYLPGAKTRFNFALRVLEDRVTIKAVEDLLHDEFRPGLAPGFSFGQVLGSDAADN
jgi:hypothetical protein